MKSNTKRLTLTIVAAFAGMVEVANAFYDPGLQRWINRDPIQEEGGINLYSFTDKDPVNIIDPFGFDCYVVKVQAGWGHYKFVGQNDDGTFWYTDLMPAPSGGIRLPNWPILGPLRREPLSTPALSTLPTPYPGFNPEKLNGEKVTQHIKTSPAVDKAVKAHVKDSAKDNTKWDLAGHNCEQYTDDLAWFTRAAKMRELLKQKQKSQRPSK